MHVLTVLLFICLPFENEAISLRKFALLKGGGRKQHERSSNVRTKRNADTGAELVPITIAVILPENKPYLFRRELVQPAIEYAVASVSDDVAELGYKFDLVYRNSFCSRRAALSAVDLYYGDDSIYERLKKLPELDNLKEKDLNSDDPSTAKRQTANEDEFLPVRSRNRDWPLALFGPACNEAASLVSTFAESWNVPLITTGAPAAWINPGPDYPTLTRVVPAHKDFALFLYTLFRYIDYGSRVPIHLVTDNTYYGATEERECNYIIQTIYSMLNEDETMIIHDPIYIFSKDFDELRLIHNMGSPKVVLMCASSDVVRRIMIAAYKQGFTNPEANVWYAIDLHNSSHYENGPWIRNDAKDVFAKEAYRSLQLLTLHVNQSAKFNDFSEKMIEKYKEAGIVTQDKRVNEFVEGFHDAVLLYTHAIKRTFAQGQSIRDGHAISRNMRNVSIDGIAGPIAMSEHGERHGDYSILAMTDYATGKYSKVFDYLGSFRDVQNLGLPRLNFSVIAKPNNIPKISAKDVESILRGTNEIFNSNGVDVESILKEAEIRKLQRITSDITQNELLAGMLGTFGGMIFCCLVIFGPMCYHKKRRSRSTNSETNNGATPFLNGNSEQLCLHRQLREEGSVATCMTSLDDDEKL